MKIAVPQNWYWNVGNKPGVVFSSSSAAYVATSDATYQAWLASGNAATNILCDGELADALLKSGAAPATVASAGASSLGGLSAADAGAVMAAMGCSIASTSTPALDGVYAVDPATQQQITSEALYIQVTGAAGTAKFTNGQTTKAWPDLAGALHTFTTAQFTAFAEALAQQVDAIAAAVAASVANGQPVVAPAAAVTIA